MRPIAIVSVYSSLAHLRPKSSPYTPLFTRCRGLRGTGRVRCPPCLQSRHYIALGRDRGLRTAKHRASRRSNNRRYLTAIGDTVEPVPP